MSNLVIIGAGGHGKLIHYLAKRLGFSQLLLVDDDVAALDALSSQYVASTSEQLASLNQSTWKMIIAIGANNTRKRLYQQYRQQGWQFANVISDQAIIADDVVIADGVVVLPGCVVNIGVTIGANCILNSNCTIEHDCRIGSHTHIAPGAVALGHAQVGEGVLLGANSTLMVGCSVGDYTIVGANSLVNKHVPSDTIVAGSPCKPLQSLVPSPKVE